MAQPPKLGDMIQEIMAILTRRRELEQRATEGQASAGDRVELEALNTRLKK